TKNSELRLICLEARDIRNNPRPPEIVWMQTLASIREKLQFDLNRRLHACTLAYADGILVCPTNAGAILGVDIATRSLAWAYSYREEPAGNAEAQPGKGGVIWVNGQPVTTMTTDWKVSAPAILDGKMVFTVPDANG